MNKKPFLVDVPVKINIWIRPDCQKKQWDVIKEARPSIIFLQSDGGRNDKEWEAIYSNRKMIDESLDWECTVYRFYENRNNGLYAMGKKVADFIWKTVDRCIFTEDDQIMSVSFFRFCAELLEKYKDDTRIECICGMNHLEKYNECSSDYFFSRQGSIWATATWKRCSQLVNTFDYAKDPYTMKLLKQRTRHNKIAWKRLNAYSKQDYYENHPAGTEFWREFRMYSENMLQIVPKYNMIQNIGCDLDSAHATTFDNLSKKMKRIYSLKKFEIDFPLKHPLYVIPDIYYEEKRNKSIDYNLTKFQHVLVRLLHLDIKFFINSYKRRKSKIKKEQ